MKKCSLTYIPKRLHWDNKPTIEEFEVGDIVYRRCKKEELENPYTSLSLTELSHNLGTSKNIEISKEKDTLFSIIESEDIEVYNLEICTLTIKSLNHLNSYTKKFEENKNGKIYIAKMDFLHDPVSCMYPHCIFRIWLNDVVITFQNYKTTLKTTNKIRTEIRQELGSMIRRKEISQDS